MMKFVYEGVNVTNKEEFEANFLNTAVYILGKGTNIIKEIVLTNDIDSSLKKRLPRIEFNKWSQEQCGLVRTAAKVFKSELNGKEYYIVLNCSYEYIVQNLVSAFLHEITHVKWYSLLDKYSENHNLSQEEFNRLDALVELVSEYCACFMETVHCGNSQNLFPYLEEILNKAEKNIIETHELSIKQVCTIPKEKIEFYLGEFNSIYIRFLGTNDAISNFDEIDLRISNTRAFFGDKVRLITNLVRQLAVQMKFGLNESFSDLPERSIIEMSIELWNAANEQRISLYNYLDITTI